VTVTFYWFLTAKLELPLADGKTGVAGLVDVVHIYKNFETTAAYEFARDEFYVPLSGSVIIDGELRPGKLLTANIDGLFNKVGTRPLGTH
jgi:hypothetical protein